jgi:hypothetical protein
MPTESLPPSSPPSYSSLSDEDDERFYTYGLHLPFRFWLALEREDGIPHSLRVPYQSGLAVGRRGDAFFGLASLPIPPRFGHPVIDLDEYLNSSPPILGSMMRTFKNRGLRVRLPGKIISVSQIYHLNAYK